MSRSAALRCVAGIERACSRAGTADDLLELVEGELRKAIPNDGSMLFAVDPVTLLATAPSRFTGLDDGYCSTFWHHEFHDQDTGLYRDLARDPVPASALRLATDGSPKRSARFREFVTPQGYADELRAVFRVGGRVWAMAGFYREPGRPEFSADDVALVTAVSSTVAGALRVRAITVPGATPSCCPGPVPVVPAAAASEPGLVHAPGLLLFDGGNALVSANDEAAAWLGQVYGCAASWLDVLADTTGGDLSVAMPVIPLLARARAVAAGYEPGPARLRLRDRSGRWLVMHASCLRGGPAGGETVAVVVEPAKSAEVAPIVIEAYGLSGREREVVGAVARGLSTPEMAAEMFLSPHTVRDYVKTVFEKVGVGSRGELVAKLFAEHYADPLHATAVHA
ncbi:MAG: LuxR C-terminal-related transcriptional regulator [Pseudonocardia sp.]